MKKCFVFGIVAACMLLAASFVEARRTYVCYRYVKGRPTGGWIYVKAENRYTAEVKAYIRFKEIGGRVDYAVCR